MVHLGKKFAVSKGIDEISRTMTRAVTGSPRQVVHPRGRGGLLSRQRILGRCSLLTLLATTRRPDDRFEWRKDWPDRAVKVVSVTADDVSGGGPDPTISNR